VSSEHMTGRVIQTPASILRTLQGHYCLVPTHKKYHKTCSNNFSKKKMYRECMTVFYYLPLKKGLLATNL
jgi:hypothetical protein